MGIRKLTRVEGPVILVEHKQEFANECCKFPWRSLLKKQISQKTSLDTFFFLISSINTS